MKMATKIRINYEIQIMNQELFCSICCKTYKRNKSEVRLIDERQRIFMRKKYGFNNLFTDVKRCLHSCQEISSQMSRDVFTDVKRSLKTHFYHYKVCCLGGKSIVFVVIMKSEGRCRIKSKDARGTAVPNTLSCIKKQRNGRA